MDHSEAIKETIQKYMDTVSISEQELYIDMQLEFDEDDEVFLIEYGLKQVLAEDSMVLTPTFRYESLEDAWENYLDQLPEIYQNFMDATIRSAHPENYEAAPGGGNPAIRIIDKSREF